jgi:hypothetical protein
MKSTKLKIEESEYFLSQMKSQNRGSKRFDFYLNAFVSSSRSITWILKSEFSNSEEWQRWYKSKEPSKEEKELLKYLNDLRIQSLKIRPLTTSNEIELTTPKEEVTDELLEKIELLTGKRGTLIFTTDEAEIEQLKRDSDPDDLIVMARLDDYRTRVNNLDNEIDIVEASEKYINSIKSLVSECEKKFST